MPVSQPHRGRRAPRSRANVGGSWSLWALVLWGGIDLYGPRRVDIRAFDPNEVARLDTAMWRSYYDRKPLALYFQLAELMRRQFHFPFLRSHLVALYAARSAFVFKGGHGRADYQRALPDLERYYHAIKAISRTPFDDRRTARLELEWWIIHRERNRHPSGQLEQALAVSAAELYRVPPERLESYARWRTEAMTIRDTSARAGGVTEEGWAWIEKDLKASWRSLWNGVQQRLETS